MGKSRSAFSLVEILVVLGIVTVLAAMSLAGLSKAAGRSRAVTCLNNLRQIGSAALLYAADHDNRLPCSSHQDITEAWGNSLQAYLEGKKLFPCPTDPNKKRSYSYAINDFLTPNPYGAEEHDYSRLSSIPSPASTLLFAECRDTYSGSDHFHFADGDVGYSPNAFASQVDVNRHGGSANYLFADGRVALLSWNTIKTEYLKPGSRFILP